MASDAICPVNVAEATLDHFFDPHLSSLPRYELSDLGGRGSTVSQYWCNARIEMPGGGHGVQLSLARPCNLDVTGYDRFVVRAALPRVVTMTVRLVIDGAPVDVIGDAAGADDLKEYEGPFAGSRLERIELQFSRADEATAIASLEWTMLASSARRAMLEHDWPVYDPSWEGYLKTSVDPAELRPDIGFVFDEPELEQLRVKVALPLYRGIYAELKMLAEAHRHDEPERYIGRVNTTLFTRYARDSLYEAPDRVGTFGEAARVLCFVGLIERDVQLLRTGARIALSHAMCGSWRCWLDTHPMSTWEHRCFQQYRTAVACAFALDWAGCVLTDYGKHVITCALAEKGLAEIQTTFMRHPYVRSNNQGLFFAWGWIVCVLAMEKQQPRAIEWLDQGIRILRETLDSYVLEDGGADEGIGYLTGSLTQALEAVLLASRRTAASPADFLPAGVLRVPAYVAANLSTVKPDGSIVPVADGGHIARPPDRLALAQIAAITGGAAAAGDATAAGLYAFLTSWPVDENPRSPGAVFEIIHGPEQVIRPDLPIPAFAAFPVSGMLSSLRRSEEHLVRLFLVGGKAHGGHSHDDRGSLIVEIDRQEALVDGAQLQYGDPQSELMKHALYHNLLTPGSCGDVGVRQLNPCPVSTVAQGMGDAVRLDCSIEVSGAWADPVARAVRRVGADCVERFVVDDLMVLRTSGPVTQRWNALRPFVRSAGGWELALDGVTLRICPEWQPAAERVERIGMDGAKRPLYQLQLEADPTVEHRLRTRFEVIGHRAH